MSLLERITPLPWDGRSMEMDRKDWAALNVGEIEIITQRQNVIAAVWCGQDRDGEERANRDYIKTAANYLPRLREALQNTLKAYVDAAQSIECGGWDAEGELHVKTARALLTELDEAMK